MNRKRISKICLLLALITTSILAETDHSVEGNVCSIDNECSPPYIMCRDSQCKRKKLFPLKGMEIAGIVLLCFLVLFGAATGVGGGAFIVPILLIFMDFNTKQAVALSNGCIFFVATFKSFFSCSKTHPTIKHKTLVDHSLVIVLLSTVLFGVFLGSTLSSIFPDLLQLLGLIIVVFYALIEGFGKSCKLYKKENMELKKKREEEGERKNDYKEVEKKEKNPEEEDVPESNGESFSIPEEEIEDGINKIKSSKNIPIVVQTETDRRKMNPPKKNLEQINEEQKPKIPMKENIPGKIVVEETQKLTQEELKLQEEIKKIEGNNFYWKKFLLGIFVLLVSLLVVLLRGGKGLKSIIGIKKCSTSDWLVNIAYGLTILIVLIMADIIVINENKMKEKAKWVPLKNEIKLDKGPIVKLNLVGIVVGVVSSMTGIGGGMITNPVLLGMHYPPQVISFSAMYIIFLNKAVAFLAFAVSGLLPLDYCIFIGLILGIGIILVEIKLGQIVKKAGRQSIIGFMFGIIMIVALGFVIYSLIRLIQDNKKNDVKMFGFKNYCDV